MMEEHKKETEKKSRAHWIVAALLLLVAGLLLLLLAQNSGWFGQTETPGYETEVAAKLGQLEGKSEEEIRAELNRVVEEGMFHIAINTDPVFQDGTSEGNLEIENVPSNRYLMRLEIIEEDTGELLYSTKYIEPNNHIQKAALDVELEAGEYPATAVFYAYDPETLTEMGSASCEINIRVLN